MKIALWKHVLIYFWSILIISLGYTGVISQKLNNLNSSTYSFFVTGMSQILKSTSSPKDPKPMAVNVPGQLAEEEEVKHSETNLLSDEEDLNFFSSASLYYSCEFSDFSDILIKIQDPPPDELS